MISSLHLPPAGPRTAAISHDADQLLVKTDCKAQALYPGLAYQLQNQSQIPTGLGIQLLNLTYTLRAILSLHTGYLGRKHRYLWNTNTITTLNSTRNCPT